MFFLKEWKEKKIIENLRNNIAYHLADDKTKARAVL